jgi:bacillopeptidase F
MLDFAMPTSVQELDPAISYGWQAASARRAFGRSYAVERLAGATASFTFSGKSVTWYTLTGPAQGKAAVSIDGVPRGTFDQHSDRPGFKVPRTFTGLGPGTHTIKIRVLGRGSSAAADTQVAVDAFEAGGTLVANPEPVTSWGLAREPGASGGRFAASDLEGSSIELTFRGTGLEWQTVRGPQHGRAEIHVDGVLVRRLDNYASEPTFGVVRRVSGLADGVHTLRIVVLGEGRRATQGTLVAIDRFSVIP